MWQTWSKPFRTEAANALDCFVNVVMIFFIVAIGLLYQIDDNDFDIFYRDLAIAMAASLIDITATCMFVMLLFAFFFMRKRKKFLAFLSHHKKDCGVAARLIKSDLMKTLGKRVYLDSDELEHLDTLLATVQFEVRFFVLLLTQETLWRPWCAGEIVTAKKAKVPFVLVKFDDFVPPGTDDCTEEALCRRFQGSAESGVIPGVGVKVAGLIHGLFGSSMG